SSARFGDVDFKAASLDGYDADWPVTYDEMAPYYTRVEKMIGVASTVQNPPTVGAWFAGAGGAVIFSAVWQFRWRCITRAACLRCGRRLWPSLNMPLRIGPGRVSIIGSQANDRWEMKI